MWLQIHDNRQMDMNIVSSFKVYLKHEGFRLSFWKGSLYNLSSCVESMAKGCPALKCPEADDSQQGLARLQFPFVG
jgi:hypothetical protein